MYSRRQDAVEVQEYNMYTQGTYKQKNVLLELHIMQPTKFSVEFDAHQPQLEHRCKLFRTTEQQAGARKKDKNKTQSGKAAAAKVNAMGDTDFNFNSPSSNTATQLPHHTDNEDPQAQISPATMDNIADDFWRRSQIVKLTALKQRIKAQIYLKCTWRREAYWTASSC